MQWKTEKREIQLSTKYYTENKKLKTTIPTKNLEKSTVPAPLVSPGMLL